MNIEIANRLVELRKKSGLSQEELANKLGISRQSVSKWERAEASPDTDNLIELSKIYGVSLDDLLKSDKSIDDVIKEKNSREKVDAEFVGNEKSSEGKRTDFSFGRDGIHVQDGNDRVDIDGDGIHVIDEDEGEVHINSSGVHINNGQQSFTTSFRSPLKMLITNLYGWTYGAAIIIYIILGLFVPNGWSVGWVLFVFAGVIPQTVEAIYHKRLGKLPLTLLCISIYLFLGMAYSLWHPYWFILILGVFVQTWLGTIDRIIKAKKSIDKIEELGNKSK